MVVAITGASAGIGKELAIQLAGRGARLSLAARRIEKLEELKQQLGQKHLILQADVSQRVDCQRFIAQTTDTFARLDTLVCNAGYGELRRLIDTTPEQIQAIFQTNLFGTVDCIRAAVPLMLKQEPREGYRGQVMIVASAGAKRGLPYFGPYAATKAAQFSLSEALRVEMRGKGIAVTSVLPIGTRTEFFDVAQARSGKRLPTRVKCDVMQEASTVAARMIKGIEKPRPEIWPFPLVKYLIAIGSLMPRVADTVMGRGRGDRIDQTI